MPGLPEIARAAGIRRNVAAQVFEEIFFLVARGERVNITGFGTFTLSVSKGRTLQTPLVNEGKPFAYPDRYLIKFKASTLAKRRINIVVKKANAEVKRAQKRRRKLKKEEG
jgi:nucleoid DNA-binding protein